MKKIATAVALISLFATTSAFAQSRLMMNCWNQDEHLNFGLYRSAEGALTGNLEVNGQSIPMVCDAATESEQPHSTAPRSIGTCHNVIGDIDPMMAARHTISLRGPGCFSPAMATYTYSPGFCGVPTTPEKTMVCNYVYEK